MKSMNSRFRGNDETSVSEVIPAQAGMTTRHGVAPKATTVVSAEAEIHTVLTDHQCHLPLISSRQRPDHVAGHGFGVPAFDISSMEQGPATRNPARLCRTPVIPQARLNVRRSCQEGVLDPRVAVA